jgi:hypothetical protein
MCLINGASSNGASYMLTADMKSSEAALAACVVVAGRKLLLL